MEERPPVFTVARDRTADDAQPKPPITIKSESRSADKAGFCRSERLQGALHQRPHGSLTNQLANERYHFDQGDQDELRNTVKSIAGLLRDTREFTVEDVVGHFIRRLSNEAKNPQLINLTASTVPDCEVMRDGLRRCSELLHVAS